MSEDYAPDDNSKWYFPIFIFWLWMLLWKWPIAVAMIVIPLCCWALSAGWEAYTHSETYRFRQAEREIDDLLWWAEHRIRRLGEGHGEDQ